MPSSAPPVASRLGQFIEECVCLAIDYAVALLDCGAGAQVPTFRKSRIGTQSLIANPLSWILHQEIALKFIGDDMRFSKTSGAFGVLAIIIALVASTTADSSELEQGTTVQVARTSDGAAARTP